MKLFKLSEGEKLYWESRQNKDGSCLVHWGALGTKGESKTVKSSFFKKAARIVEAEMDKMVADGYEEIDVEDHSSLIIEYKIDDWGTDEDFDKRDLLEDRINELVDCTGLGECDGAGIGSGTMELFYYVVDFEIAKKVIEADLAGTEFANYSRIYEGARP